MNYKEADKSKAICDLCKQIVTTTIHKVNVADTNFNIVQNDMLVVKSDLCGNIITIPNQKLNYENK